MRASATGMLYVLDEPSVGLHPTNVQGLRKTITALAGNGNTVIVVEHEQELIRSADWVIELGPGAGARGGTVITQGTPGQLETDPQSIIGPFLAGATAVPRDRPARSGPGGGPPGQITIDHFDSFSELAGVLRQVIHGWGTPGTPCPRGVSPVIRSVFAGQTGSGTLGTAGTLSVGRVSRQPVATGGAGGQLPVRGHPLAGFLHVVVAEPGRLRNNLRGAAWMLVQVAEDRGPGVTQGVLAGWPVEQEPGPGVWQEPQRVLGFVYVAAGHVQYAVCLFACAFEDEAPRFADLRRPGKQVHPFGEDAGHGPVGIAAQAGGTQHPQRHRCALQTFVSGFHAARPN